MSAEEIRSPQKYDIKSLIMLATILGLVITTFDFIVFGLFYHRPPAVLQTNWFISCILIELAFTFSVRSMVPIVKAKAPSLMIVLLSLAMGIITLILPFTQFGQKWLHFTAPTFHDLSIIAVLVIVCFGMTELVKTLYYYFYKYKGS
jgi:magnesium-transporting ATPase (P-type)